MKRLLLTIAALMLATGLWAAPGTAAPYQSQAPAAASDGVGLEPAQYGCRRDCHYSPQFGNWIRRVGPYCEVTYCTPPQQYAPPPPRHYAPPRHCSKDWHCEKTGPFGLGKRCYWRDICG